MARIPIPQAEIEAFCRRHHIRWLALFGSVLRDEFRDASDVDVLVEFELDHRVGWALFDIERELSTIVGCTVDLNTPAFLSRYFRDEVMEEAEVWYDAA